MRHFTFDELNFKNYSAARIEVMGGSRPRLVLKHSRGQTFFLKTYRHNSREVWAEMLASQLGEVVGVQVQDVSLKRIPRGLVKIFQDKYSGYLPPDWKPVGALVRNVFPKDHELLYGRQILGTATDPVRLDDIEKAVRERYIDGEDILQRFSDMIVFDAWIGNMDRHHENWAITQRSMPQQLTLLKLTKQQREELKTKRRFSSLYDHGSSLLFELGEEKVVFYLKNPAQFIETYILGKKYALLLDVDGSSQNVFKILRSHVEDRTSWRRRIRKSIEGVLCADSLKVAQLILQMPTGGDLDYSQDRKRLLYSSLEERKKILKEIFSL